METASKRRMVTLALRIIRRNLKMRRRRRGGKNYNRAKAVHKTPNIPEEIVLHILSRLPLKSLSRFKCVSKQWRCLISDVFGKATGRHMVVIASKSNLGEASCTIQTINKEEAQVESITIPVRESSSHGLLRIFGSCNGLLLIGIDQGLFLWNPLTRYFKNVMSYDYLQDDRYEIVSGLCYNSSTNEYKAVIALAHFSPDIGGEYVVICNLRSKSATVINFPYILTEVRSGSVVNGYLHWFVPKKGDFRMLASHQIIYFNPQTDVFETIPMPHPKREDGDCMLGLGDLLGCLCMARWEHPGNTDECNVEVLAMTEYGVETSWTIMFIISCIYFRPLDQAVPLGYTKDGEALIETGSEGWRTSEGWHIWAYDPIDDSRREIVIPDAPFKFNAVTYVESLVTPSCYH